jgi:hypothetical protein
VTWIQLAALVALVAYALPNFICARPRPPRRQGGVESHSKNQAVDRQLAHLRDELGALRLTTSSTATVHPVPIRHRLGKPDRPA